MRYCLFLIAIACSFICLVQAAEYPYIAKRDRDPMDKLINNMGQILIKEKSEFSGFNLQGILYSDQGSKAVINNEIFNEGDMIAGHVVKKIEEYKVFLEKDGKEFVLKWEG